MIQFWKKWLGPGDPDAGQPFSLRVDEAEAGDEPLIRLAGVTRVLGTGSSSTVALQDVDLEVRRGEFVEIEGPSGCGKTTLLSILGLLDVPSSGSYSLAGRDVGSLSARGRADLRNREVGFVFQSFNLLGDLTVFENVELPLTYLGLRAAERKDRVMQSLERFSLTDRAQRYPTQLSGGHQQRVAVARAVVGRPALLLADEPTGNLNSEQAVAVVEMLNELHAEGTTICLVSHDPRWREVARRTLRLFDGRLVPSAPGTTSDPA